MNKFYSKIVLLVIFIGLSISVLAVELKARVTREEFAEFYGVLIIEEEFIELNIDEVFNSCFDPVTGKPRRDEIFSVRSPFFGPDILKKKQREEKKVEQNFAQEEGYKSVYNVKLNTKQEPDKKTFKDNILTAKNIIESGQNIEKAGNILTGLEEKNNENPANLTNIAKLYIKKGELPKAIELLEKAKNLAPDDYKILYTYGVTLYKNDQLELAEINLFRTTQLKPDFMFAHYNLGNIYYKQQKYKKALDSFKKAMGLSPDKADIYFNIAIILEQLGYNDMAARFYTKCLELNPNDDEAFKAIQRLN